MFDADPAETVRRCGGHPGWAPFASAEDGNHLAVDLDSAANGRPGQVIGMGRDHDKGPSYFADLVISLLGRYLSLLEQGAYKTYNDFISLPEPASGASPKTFIREAEAYRVVFNQIRPHEALGFHRPIEVLADPLLHPIHKNQPEDLVPQT